MSPIGVWETPEPGVSRKVFGPGRSLMMMEVHFEAGATGALHSHPHEQMTYCLSGSFEFTVGGRSCVIRAGDTLHIPRDVKHGVKALEAGALLDAFTPLREDLLKG